MCKYYLTRLYPFFWETGNIFYRHVHGNFRKHQLSPKLRLKALIIQMNAVHIVAGAVPLALRDPSA